MRNMVSEKGSAWVVGKSKENCPQAPKLLQTCYATCFTEHTTQTPDLEIALQTSHVLAAPPPPFLFQADGNFH